MANVIWNSILISFDLTSKMHCKLLIFTLISILCEVFVVSLKKFLKSRTEYLYSHETNFSQTGQHFDFQRQF